MKEWDQFFAQSYENHTRTKLRNPIIRSVYQTPLWNISKFFKISLKSSSIFIEYSIKKSTNIFQHHGGWPYFIN